jgi:AbiU2
MKVVDALCACLRPWFGKKTCLETIPSLDVQSIQQIAERGFWDGLEILVVIEMLEFGNLPLVQAGFNRSGTRLAADVVKNALVVHLVFLVTRALGSKKIRSEDRHAGMVFEQLKNSVLAGTMQSPEDVADAQEQWRKCRSDQRKERVVEYRNKFLAHDGEPKLDPPEYDELFEFARAIASALEKLAHGTGAEAVSHGSQLQARKASAEKFWQALADR